MKTHLYALVLMILLVSTSLAADSPPPYAEPRGLCDEKSYPGSGIDAFGDIIGTIPCAPPGTNNVWEGEAWANGELIVFKNIGPSPYSSPPQFYRINPQTGAVIAIVNLPFSGYVTDGCFDGTNLWIVQWSPVSVIHCVSLAGVEIFSFPGNLGAWKASCVAWDGSYLWAGLNAEWYNTRLHKYSTTGTLLLNWATGTVVGWYLGSEINTQAPMGSNLYVVDDAGHTIKRLNIGTTVTVVEQMASPAATPDQPVGLTFDGEYLWHGGAYATQGLIWKIDDGITTPQPSIAVTLTPINPPIIIPAAGGNFSFNATLANQGSSPATFDVWIMIQLPSMSWYGPVLGPLSLTLPASFTLVRTRSQSIPATAPAGNYWYEARVGTYPSTVVDTSGFAFIKSVVGNGPYVNDWSCSGEDFDLWMALDPEVIPASFSLQQNYPNPFNPTTAIRYQIPEARYVSLRVYDTAGRLVATLMEGWREAGEHQVTFDGQQLPSGMYFFQLTSGLQVQTQKAILLK